MLAPVPETAGVRTVRPIEGGELHAIGGALPVLGPGGRAARDADAARGAGASSLLADASPLQNRGLAREDNAALGLALAAPGGGDVPGDGPRLRRRDRARRAARRRALGAAGLLLAALAFAWSHARRIGPPEDAERPLPPPRADYVDALAGSLARTGRPAEVARPLHEAARAGLARRAGLGPEPGEAELRAAAARIGLGEAETAALLRAPRGSRRARWLAARPLAQRERVNGREAR